MGDDQREIHGWKTMQKMKSCAELCEHEHEDKHVTYLRTFYERQHEDIKEDGLGLDRQMKG